MERFDADTAGKIVTVIDDANVFNDKQTITADPTDADLVYGVWDRLVFPPSERASDAPNHAYPCLRPHRFTRERSLVRNQPRP